MIRDQAKNIRVVLVTCPSLALGRKMARAVVQKRLAACVNVALGPLESFYRWKGKSESAREHLLIIKTTARRLAQLEKEVHRLHPYDLPEFIALPVVAGSHRYLSWLQENVGASRR